MYKKSTQQDDYQRTSMKDESEEISSDTAFTNSDYDDAEQQRFEFGDQADTPPPKLSPLQSPGNKISR